jgi:hypothetical protein
VSVCEETTNTAVFLILPYEVDLMLFILECPLLRNQNIILEK